MGAVTRVLFSRLLQPSGGFFKLDFPERQPVRNPDPLPSVGAAPPASPLHAAIYFTPGLLTKVGNRGRAWSRGLPRRARLWLPLQDGCRALPAIRISRGAGPASRAPDRRVRQVSRAPGASRAFLRPPPGTGPYRPLRAVPRTRPGAAALLVHPAARTAGSRPTRLLGA